MSSCDLDSFYKHKEFHPERWPETPKTRTCRYEWQLPPPTEKRGFTGTSGKHDLSASDTPPRRKYKRDNEPIDASKFFRAKKAMTLQDHQRRYRQTLAKGKIS